MSNYNQYYYKGDTINAKVVEDGFALDLRNDKTRSKMYDSDYRWGLAKQLNSLYRRTYGKESGISDMNLSSEILFHAEMYDFSESLNGNTEREKNIKNFLYDATKEANMGRNDKERWIYPLMVQSINYK